jgi:hypothetical protein
MAKDRYAPIRLECLAVSDSTWALMQYQDLGPGTGAFLHSHPKERYDVLLAVNCCLHNAEKATFGRQWTSPGSQPGKL